MTTDSVSRTGYLTLRQAAAWLGMGSGRAAALRLQRLFEAMERRDGKEILTRSGEGNGRRLRVTRAVLRAYLPEHWADRERIVGILRDRLGGIDTELQRGRVERRVLGRKVAELTSRLSQLEKSPSSTDPAVNTHPMQPGRRVSSAHECTRVHADQRPGLEPRTDAPDTRASPGANPAHPPRPPLAQVANEARTPDSRATACRSPSASASRSSAASTDSAGSE